MPRPEPDSGGTPDGEGPNEIRSGYVSVRESPTNEAEAIARQFKMDQNQFARLNFEKDLAKVTCDCGHGYFKPDKTWVSGADVRAGLAPSKPPNWS
jgi:hypothetical protein